jgi:hypothetical protein
MDKITIITTFKDDYNDLLLTIDSILLQKDIKIFHILLNASNTPSTTPRMLKYFSSDYVSYYDTPCMKQYECINIGIGKVKTERYLLINTGTTFITKSSIIDALCDADDFDLIINSAVVTNKKNDFLVDKIDKKEPLFGMHHEAFIYYNRCIKHDLSIGHIADLDFMSKHLKAAEDRVKFNIKPLIFYPRGGLSDVTPIDSARVFNTVVISYRIFFRGQFKTSYRLLHRAVKDFFLLIFGRVGNYEQ